ncbi:MAG TPA: hemerythrin domain-containing protein [Thermoanaerobaculia bacterium]|nr:hemerythrin domain-containing protein [Thermoanaerobaculia bacterium]
MSEPPPTTLVCHSLPPAERNPAVLAAFDRLAAYESFHLASDHSQAPLLALLRQERPGLFEWCPFEEGPPLWRTEIVRRPAALALREVSEALSWDHDRLDLLEEAAQAARDAGQPERAAELFHRFTAGLRRHQDCEGAILFPEFDRLCGLQPDDGPTAILRLEHRRIEGLLGKLERSAGASAETFEPLRRELRHLLGLHHGKEEQLIFPTLDRLLPPEGRDELVYRVQAYRR